MSETKAKQPTVLRTYMGHGWNVPYVDLCYGDDQPPDADRTPTPEARVVWARRGGPGWVGEWQKTRYRDLDKASDIVRRSESPAVAMIALNTWDD